MATQLANLATDKAALSDVAAKTPNKIVTTDLLGSQFGLNEAGTEMRLLSLRGKEDGFLYKHNIGVFEGFISSLTGGLADDFAEPTNVDPAAVLSDNIVHFRLPLKAGAGASNQMYRLHFQGYVLGAARNIDFFAVGYAYTAGLTGAQVTGTHAADTTQYTGSDGHVYVRVDFGNGYYNTVTIDSMGVGNGAALEHGSITAHINPAATL